jgi:cell division protein FtsL
MLKVDKFLSILQMFLFVLIILSTTSMFLIKYRVYTFLSDSSKLDKRMKELKNEKSLLIIELTYLTSTERIFSLIDNDSKVLDNKEILKYTQIKTKDEFAKISLARLKQKESNSKLADTSNAILKNLKL